MIATSPLIAFIPARNLAYARRFYEDVLGLHFVSDDGFALVMSANGTMVRIVHVGEFTPALFTILGWQVADIHHEIAALNSKGLSFVRYPNMKQSDDCVWTAPGGAQVAWFRDPDGNVLSITQL